MSHFLALVILPLDTAPYDVAAATEQALEPFGEHIRVESHEVGCLCVGLQARMDVELKVEQAIPQQSLRALLEDLPEEERTEERWNELVKPRAELRATLLAEHPLTNKANPACIMCKGTGTRVTESNPRARWDWWVIGGRWDGWIFGPEQEEASRGSDGFNSGASHERVENNCRPVSEIPLDDPYYVPFALLTPDGEWIEQGAMGWWGIVSDAVDRNAWNVSVRAVLERYKDHLAVAVDCHT